MVSATSRASLLARHPDLVGWLRITQGILVAMLAGAASFAAVLLLAIHPIGSRTQEPSGAGKTASVVLGVVALVLVALFAGARIAMRRRAQSRLQREQEPDNPALASAHETETVRRLALSWLVSTFVFVVGLDIAAFFCFVGYVVGDRPALVAVAAALVVFMALQMPTRRGLDAWLGQPWASRPPA